MDNYEISRERAKSYFLTYDQEKIINRWNIPHDGDFFYVRFLDRPYRICRHTGDVVRLFDGAQAGFSEVLSIFDLLCHSGEASFLTGEFAPVNSLRGRPASVGVDADHSSKAASLFDRAPERFRAACLGLGGVPIQMGDMGFRFPIFGEMQAILKFYHSDEEFPASITLLWDENTLQYMYYETVFYVAGFLIHEICKEMEK